LGTSLTESERFCFALSPCNPPHQIFGGNRPNQIYHVAVMPCYDKKLEASREDFYNDVYRTRDVDCVITTGELEKIFEEKGQQIATTAEAPLDTLFSKVHSQNGEEVLLGTAGGGSGGYLEAIFRYAAMELFGVELQAIEYKVGKNQDFKETSLEVDGKVVLRFATAYGFRNIQNFVRKVKTKNVPYHFVEVMACPSGCLNGGGQIKAEPAHAKEFLAQVEQAYESVTQAPPEKNTKVHELYEEWLGAPSSAKAKEKLHTKYHAIEKTLANPLSVQW